VENKLVAIGLPNGGTAYIHDNALPRTDGVPPLVAVKGDSSAVLTHNTIRGGGVAGLLVQGSALVLENQFVGKGGRQGSAIWVWKGSTATISANQFDGYRNAVNADGSAVTISDNIVERFQGTAIVVKEPSTPANILGNTAKSDDPKAKVVEIDENKGVVANNRVAP